MEITSIITKKDYQEFLQYYFKSTHRKGKLKWLYQGCGFFFGIFAIGSVLYLYEAYKYTKLILINDLFNAFLVSLICLVTWLVLSYFYKKEITNNGLLDNGSTLGEFLIILSDDNIKEIGNKHTFECSWDAITEITRTQNLILLSIEPYKGIMIHVNDEELAKEIINFSEKKVSKKDNLIV